MENQGFQTSFIPKQSLAKKETVRKKTKRGMSLITLVALFLFIVSLLMGGGVVFYKSVLQKRVASMEASLNRAQASFDASLVQTLEDLDRRLKISEDVLNRHTIASPLFHVLQDITMKSVRFSSIDFSVDNTVTPPLITVSLQGAARSYTSIALQSDLFTDHPFISNPIFTNLNLDAAGNVLFDLKISVDPELLLYEHAVSRQTAQPAPEVTIPVEATTNEEPGVATGTVEE